MKIVLNSGETHKTRFVSDNCFYIIPQEEHCVLCSTFQEAIEHVPLQNRVVDPVAVLSLLFFGYVCGDRTMVRGLKRIPLHSVISSKGEIMRERQLPHGNKQVAIEEITPKLLGLLTDEIDKMVRSESEVVILLSGGLDSRITAGVLKRLQDQHGFNVTAVTWGSMYSRDWIFADRICEIYNWEHVNAPIGPETLWRNIKHSVDCVGAEVAGEHFHAINELRQYLPEGVLILASTYGDSIGRAAYSGTHIEQLGFPNPNNRDGLFYQTWFRRSRNDLIDDIRAPWSRGDVHTQKQAYEIALQENYLRRQLDVLLRCLNNDFRLYQVFTSEAIVRSMWSLDTSLRDDRVYQALIPMLDHELARIPWQKTNQALVENAWSPSTEPIRDFHNYPGWIHTDLKVRFETYLFGDCLGDLLYVNPGHVRFQWRQFQKMDASHPHFKRMSRLFVRIMGVLMLMRDYQIVCDDTPFVKTLYDRTDLPLRAVWHIRRLKRQYRQISSTSSQKDPRFLLENLRG